MAYSLNISISLGATNAGLTLRAQLVDTAGVNVGADIEGIIEIGSGNYSLLASVPDGHLGGIKIYEVGGGGVILAFGAINPEEAEQVGRIHEGTQVIRADDRTGAAIPTAAQIATQVEQQIINEADSILVLEAIVNKINAMTDLDALTLAAIAAEVRTVLEGAGTKLTDLHDRLTAARAANLDNLDVAVSTRATPADVAAGTGTIEGLTATQRERIMLAFVAGKQTLTNNGDATKTLTAFAQDGVTPVVSITFNATGAHISTAVLI